MSLNAKARSYYRGATFKVMLLILSGLSVMISSEGYSLSLPSHVSLYASQPAGNGQECVVGVSTDADGMNQKPVAYLQDAHGKTIWRQSLKLPRYTYQGRATHCQATADAFFVLIQADTEPQETLSQTLLQVVKLDRRDGKVLAAREVDVPNISVACTTWVDKGNANFSLHGGRLAIQGHYALMSNKDHTMDFSVEIPASEPSNEGNTP